MQAGDYAGALPLLEQAVGQPAEHGQAHEAHASYNRRTHASQLGNCDGVLELLDRAESIEGRKDAIGSVRQQARTPLALRPLPVVGLACSRN